jgi:hypothetical protein
MKAEKQINTKYLKLELYPLKILSGGKTITKKFIVNQ